ncbi:Hpt domain-containing protein [Novosphingobium aquimarinum]|uniref:Hpt domain-containing protein n=1 Tax=Novosphingobium aquimarinum TaxID=2682494 RepID=UPI0012EB70E7|nr:Hpt domain-containing protein [Novosphingobium aquimarinum]
MPQATMPNAIRNPQLIARFEARRTEFLRTLRRFKRSGGTEDEKVEAILTELHKLAGVATLFGATNLGRHAKDYQAKLRTASIERRPEILSEMLEAFSDDGVVLSLRARDQSRPSRAG